MKSRQWMQIAAVASAMGLTGAAIANDMDRTPGTNDSSASTTIDNAATSAQGANPAADLNTNADVNGGAGLRDHSSGSAHMNGKASTLDHNDTATQNGNSTSDLNGPVDHGATQGSTMTSPKSNASTDANAPTADYGSGSSATSNGSDRLGNTNSDNFNTWMSDYASQHNGRITREEFLAKMGNRWDQLDAQHQGYLTPDQVQEILVITPSDNVSSQERVAPPSTGSGLQSGDVGSDNTRRE